MKKLLILMILFPLVCFGQARPHWLQIQGKPGLVQVADVKDFGAVGDGTTDDRAAIQAAIDYAQENRVPVYVSAPDVYYAVKSTHPDVDAALWVNQSRVRIIGHGSTTSVTSGFLDIFGDYENAVAAPDSFLLIQGVVSAKGCTIENLNIRANYVTDVIKSTGNAQFLTVRGCLVGGGVYTEYGTKLPTNGINIGGGYGTIIEGTEARACKTGFRVSGPSTSITFKSTYAAMNRDYGYYLEHVFYSSLISTASDSTGYLRSSGTHYGSLGYGYYITNSDNIVMISAGAEDNRIGAYIADSIVSLINARFSGSTQPAGSEGAVLYLGPALGGNTTRIFGLATTGGNTTHKIETVTPNFELYTKDVAASDIVFSGINRRNLDNRTFLAQRDSTYRAWVQGVGTETKIKIPFNFGTSAFSASRIVVSALPVSQAGVGAASQTALLADVSFRGYDSSIRSVTLHGNSYNVTGVAEGSMDIDGVTTPTLDITTSVTHDLGFHVYIERFLPGDLRSRILYRHIELE